MNPLIQTKNASEFTALVGFGCLGAFVGLVLFAAVSAGCGSSKPVPAFAATERHTTPDVCATAKVVPAKAEGFGVPPDTVAATK